MATSAEIRRRSKRLELRTTPEERELIDRKYFAGESVKEIAEEMQTTEKAIESRLVRVRRKLKDLVLVQLKDENSIQS